MTDETSRQGYDDVLSSVRRIVASEAEAAAEAETGKLLLTPALRVASSDEETPGPRDAAPPLDFPTLEDRIAELEAAVGSEPADWEPDGSEDQAQHAPDAVVLPLNPAARRADPARPDPETDDSDLVFAVPGESGDSEADDGDAAEGKAGPADSQVAEQEAPAPSSEPSAEPPLATFRHRGQLPSAPRDNVLDDDEPALLDEGALRDLVAEIVREELQGGLGERITRNVRKLVRAEIQRAFAARDLD